MHATVTELLRAVGPPTLVPWSVPHRVADRPVTDVVIHAPADPAPLDEGAVVLAVGVEPEQLAALAEAAATARAPVVVVRDGVARRADVVAATDGHEVAVLALSPALGWAEFASVVRNAIATGGDHVSDPHLDLTTAANSLAAAVNGSVLVFNPQQEVLAFSRLRPTDDAMRRRAVADQRGPAGYREHLSEMGVYRRLWGGDEVVEIPAVPQFEANRRLAVAIRAGDEILGSIWVAEGGEPLSPDVAGILRAAAVSASGHLAWLQARAQTQRRFVEGLVVQLLTGDADVDAVAGWLGVAVDSRCAVVLVASGRPGARRRLVGQLTLHLSAFRTTPLVAPFRDAVALVLTGLDDDGASAPSVPDTLRRVVQGLDEPLLVAVGDPQAGLGALPASHVRAAEVLAALRRRVPAGESRVATCADARAEVVLDRLHDHVRSTGDLDEGPAGRLLAWDEQHGTAYAESVLAFLEAHGSVAAAAGRVHVHPNSVRYRLRRARELVGLDLDDPAARVVAELELGARLSDRTGTTAHVGVDDQQRPAPSD